MLNEINQFNEHLKNEKRKERKLFLYGFICRFFGHSYKLKRNITPCVREIECKRCIN